SHNDGLALTYFGGAEWALPPLGGRVRRHDGRRTRPHLCVRPPPLPCGGHVFASRGAGGHHLATPGHPLATPSRPLAPPPPPVLLVRSPALPRTLWAPSVHHCQCVAVGASVDTDPHSHWWTVRTD